jgi:hypothetical protein
MEVIRRPVMWVLSGRKSVARRAGRRVGGRESRWAFRAVMVALSRWVREEWIRLVGGKRVVKVSWEARSWASAGRTWAWFLGRRRSLRWKGESGEVFWRGARVKTKLAPPSSR